MGSTDSRERPCREGGTAPRKLRYEGDGPCAKKRAEKSQNGTEGSPSGVCSEGSLRDGTRETYFRRTTSYEGVTIREEEFRAYSKYKSVNKHTKNFHCRDKR